MKEYKESDKPKKGRWCPGDYMCSCHKCQEGFIGDKRSVTCADCAYKVNELDDEEKYTDKEWLMVQSHAKLIAKLNQEHKKQNSKLRAALEEIKVKLLTNDINQSQLYTIVKEALRP